MLTYALGRGLEHYDMPAVRKIARDAAQQQLPCVFFGCRESSTVVPSRCEGGNHDHYEDGLTAADVPARAGRNVRLAAARCDGAGIFRHCEKRCQTGMSPGIRLCAERHGDERRPQLLDAERHRGRLRVLSNSVAAGAVSRSADDRERPRTEAGRIAGRWQRRTHACLRDLVERHPSEENGRRRYPACDDGRSDRRGATGQGDGAALHGVDFLRDRS